MPYMFKESPQKAAAVSLGDVTIPANEFTAGAPKERAWDTTNTNITLPAGAYSVLVKHVDPTGGTITVNGEEKGFNRSYQRSTQQDLVGKKQDFAPEVIILNPEGRKVAISVSYPSSSNVNPSVL